MTPEQGSQDLSDAVEISVPEPSHAKSTDRASAELARLLLGPWRLDPYNGTFIWAPSAKGGETHVADVRGWGYLIGGGHGALGFDYDEAAAVQDGIGKAIAAAPDALRFVEAFLSYISVSDTDDWDFGRGVVASGLISMAEAVRDKAKPTPSEPPSTGRRGNTKTEAPEVSNV